MQPTDHDEATGTRHRESHERAEPPITERTGQFWTSGADGVLRLLHCRSCGRYQHPPRPVCPSCRGRDLGWEDLSGRGTVWSWTVNRYQWQPGMEPPYLIAEVELVEQEGLRLLTNIVDCELDAVRIGLPVEVCFVRSGAAHIPVFRPVSP